MSPDEAMVVDNIWLLTPSERHRLYLFWVENYRERYRVEIHRGEQEYEQRCHELEAVRFEEEQEVIRRATVVGMTTSGAARYHSVLQRVAPKIVVIEEAAEVMEAHIITSLSHDTKHTILIGDHKQLRPKATVYELAQKYNLAISLFERMIMNSMDCKRLCIQHRMRPEIAALTKRIYDHEIVDHESVCEFDDIKGVTHNLFFIDHCQPEILVGGLQSYSNPHEADFLVALCNYLLLQGYGRSQITILTMYTGQLLLLQEKMPRKNIWRSQGESNRICVALSRARQGFYCIGNFSMLSQCKLWKEICDYLQTKNAIGQILTLVCKKHENVTNVRSSSDFDRSGGCKMPCGDRLDCGHACDRLCHVSDLVHKDASVFKNVLQLLPQWTPV
ncbi:NFX1-type zinc finger-containing protein 1 [Desmophyllum pertusum]|uniref:NFX1-type zinc finger-containing protein 1 n=1 Tax=Desmophyllum pertusum TaxID=174260 RepID=A0A9X0CIP4_9CNID|nr:NFX1-type zinc finger-containing protein 1 [Desmophyllum pertusum]